MKLFFAIVVSAAALMAAPQDKKADQKPAPVKAADGSKPMAIPAGATRSEDGDFHYIDPQGKKWIYRQTPFGVARLEEKSEAQTNALAAEKAAGIKATEEGDKVRFERQGPFGVWKWEKKMSELDATETAALQKTRAENMTSKQE
uniref:Uncharacterized protein n=1 Tax=Solibacter usitatus (strain Ellin6076) TaxID=234267 RepID=Q01NT4_SOLUE